MSAAPARRCRRCRRRDHPGPGRPRDAGHRGARRDHPGRPRRRGTRQRCRCARIPAAGVPAAAAAPSGNDPRRAPQQGAHRRPARRPDQGRRVQARPRPRPRPPPSGSSPSTRTSPWRRSCCQTARKQRDNATEMRHDLTESFRNRSVAGEARAELDGLLAQVKKIEGRLKADERRGPRAFRPARGAPDGARRPPGRAACRPQEGRGGPFAGQGRREGDPADREPVPASQRPDLAGRPRAEDAGGPPGDARRPLALEALLRAGHLAGRPQGRPGHQRRARGPRPHARRRLPQRRLGRRSSSAAA